MPKKRCPHCKDYNYAHEAINVNGRYFCSIDHAYAYGKKKKEAGKKKRYAQ